MVISRGASPGSIQPASDKTLVTACDTSACRTCTKPPGALLPSVRTFSTAHRTSTTNTPTNLRVLQTCRVRLLDQSTSLILQNPQATEDEAQSARTIPLRTSQHILPAPDTQDAITLIPSQLIAYAAGSTTSTALFSCFSSSRPRHNGTQWRSIACACSRRIHIDFIKSVVGRQ